MKKIYLGASAIILSGSMIAQNSIVKRDFEPTKFELSTEGGKQINNATGNEKSAQVIWSDDFSTPGNWTIDNDLQTGADYGWTIGTTSNSWSGPGSSINSTSGGNYAQVNNGDPTATPATQALDVVYTMTTATPIDVDNLTGGSNIVTLSYEQMGARFNDAQEVYVSTDGNTWILVDDNSDKDVLSASGGSAYANPTTELINISSAIAADPTQVWIRFQWTTAFPGSTSPNAWVTYGWLIDDVQISTADDNDLTLSAHTMGQGAFQWPYYLLTPEQVADITFSANVTNNGAATQPNTMLEVTEGATTYSSAGVALAALGSDSLVATTNFNPGTSLNQYSLNFEVVSDSVDANPNDNIATESIEVNSFIYARDKAGLNGTATTGSVTNWANAAGDAFKIGNIFEVMADDMMYAVDVKFSGTIPAGGALVFAEVYRYDAGADDYLFVETTEELDLQSAAQVNAVQTLVLNGPVALTAGDDILVVAGHYGSDMGIAYSGSAPDNSVVGYDGSNSLVGLADPVNMCVRMNFDPSVGIVENAEAGLTLGQNMPNPFDATSNVNFEIASSSNVEFVVTDMSGKVMEVINMGNLPAGNHNLVLDANNYASGVYYYTLRAGENQITNKMVIQK